MSRAVRAGRGAVLPVGEVELTGGLLADWQRRNREATVPHAIAELRKAGNLENLRRLADPSVGAYRGRYPFLDTDLYKTLEGLAYEIGRDDAPAGAREFFDEVVGLLEQAQAEDGYLNSFFQDPDQPKQPWSDLGWGHELYNLGHLIQAAVAAHRRLGDSRLLTVAGRFADLVVRKFGKDGEEVVDGHPEVEMALVELYRETGTEDYLAQAQLFVDRRGQGKLKHTIFPAEYFQDNAPFRELPSVTGHAVRMAYLAAGAADVALETGDQTLLTALERLWDDMVATKLYLTGGLGSRHSDEAIGDRYELPSERAYTETCAAIATMQWAWRMFLATGKASYLDVYETVLYNAYAVGLSADGTAFFYDNPLQRRPDHEQRSGAESGGEPLRRSWFGCPCCPPNIVRWMSELQDHVAAQQRRHAVRRCVRRRTHHHGHVRRHRPDQLSVGRRDHRHRRAGAGGRAGDRAADPGVVHWRRDRRGGRHRRVGGRATAVRCRRHRPADVADGTEGARVASVSGCDQRCARCCPRPACLLRRAAGRRRGSRRPARHAYGRGCCNGSSVGCCRGAGRRTRAHGWCRSDTAAGALSRDHRSRSPDRHPRSTGDVRPVLPLGKPSGPGHACVATRRELKEGS